VASPELASDRTSWITSRDLDIHTATNLEACFGSIQRGGYLPKLLKVGPDFAAPLSFRSGKLDATHNFVVIVNLWLGVAAASGDSLTGSFGSPRRRPRKQIRGTFSQHSSFKRREFCENRYGVRVEAESCLRRFRECAVERA